MELLQPDVRRIAPPEPEPTSDRIADEWAGGTPEPLRGELTALLGADRVLTLEYGKMIRVQSVEHPAPSPAATE